MEVAIDGIINRAKICSDCNEPRDFDDWEELIIEKGKVAGLA